MAIATRKAVVKERIAVKPAKVSVMKIAARKKIGGIVFKPDTKQSATLQKLGRAGATNAIRASKALGLPITYLEKGVVIKEQSNGDKEIIATVSNTITKNTIGSLKKGMIFHAKK